VEMEENELSRAWRAGGQLYADAVNDFVARGMRDGWPDKEPAFPDHQTPLADAVLKVVREANRSGNASTLRERFPPAAHPFTDKVKSDGRALDPVIWIDDENVALHVGAPSEAGPIFIANSNGISEFPGILGFGRSHDRTFIALASAAGIEIRRGWNGEVTATIPWPSLFENIPAPHQKPRAPKPLTITQLAVFPDGERVLLASPSGVFILTRDGAIQLLPQPDEYEDWLDDDDVSRLDLAMEHAALSPDGTLILAGHQSSSHLVFDARGRRIVTLEAHSEYPHFAWFSADGQIAGFNSCHFYSGASFGIPVTELHGESLLERSHPSVRALQDGARVYAAVARNDEFIIGDAYGYLRAFDVQGNFRWQHFVGSTICSLDLSPDGRKLAVTSYAGILCVLDLDSTERDPYAIGTGLRHPRELWRWIFWKGEERPLRW
jgi:WD40 repeat protein